MIFIIATMNAMPVYWMGLFKLHSSILNELDKIRRKFFSGELPGINSSIKKLHTINWKKICLSKENGGLGLSFLTYKNVSLLSKWLWKLHKDINSLWYKVVKGKYGRYIHDIFTGTPNSRNIKKMSTIM